MNEKRMNLIFLGSFAYPQGMAGTKLIQHAIDGIRHVPDVSIRVIVLRQSSEANPPFGFHRGIPYETIMPDLIGAKLALLAPLLFAKAKCALRKVFDPESKNILYVYGPPAIDNVPVVRAARRLGYNTVFDIVEDDETVAGISSSFYQRIKSWYILRSTRQIRALADGIVVISSHLERKFADLTGGSIPVHLRPISVDFSHFKDPVPASSEATSMFYAGSYGVKDGVNNLLDAFETLAPRYPFLRLVLTGKGSKEAMQRVLSRIAHSSFSDRIDYKGYLDDDTYYATLRKADIPCMTRIDLAYAHAGFPFKLGEFLATGKSVIVSRVSDVEHFLKDKHDALLVEPGSVADIVRAVEYILQNPEAAREIGRRGKDRAFASFDLHSQAKALHSFLSAI